MAEAKDHYRRKYLDALRKYLAALSALRELVAAGDFAVTSNDDVAIMLRLGRATDAARAVIAKAEGA